MNKGERTRRKIVECATALINRHGFAGMSMSDLMRETGLEKGGLYRHFDSKEAIAAAAFDHYVQAVTERIGSAIAGIESPLERLLATVRTLGAIGWDPVVQGGCMVMNLAIESDYADLPFRPAARQAISRWRALIRRDIRGAVRAGELRSGVDAEALASIIISSIEGGIMLSGIEADPTHAKRVVAHLESHIQAQRP